MGKIFGGKMSFISYLKDKIFGTEEERMELERELERLNAEADELIRLHESMEKSRQMGCIPDYVKSRKMA